MHKLGYTGKGVTIAIADTGLNSSHEQFAGKVLYENCFSWSWSCKVMPDCEPCDKNVKECDPEKCWECEEISACEGGSVENYGKTNSAYPGAAKNKNVAAHQNRRCFVPDFMNKSSVVIIEKKKYCGQASRAGFPGSLKRLKHLFTALVMSR